jgi:hypothetical protein
VGKSRQWQVAVRGRFGQKMSESGFSRLTEKTGFGFSILPFLSILKILILTAAF